jgi:hypothetical protein
MASELKIGIYLDAGLHSDFWERLAAHIIMHGFPEDGTVINLYPEIPRDETGWEITAPAPLSPRTPGTS